MSLPPSDASLAEQIIELERSALTRWGQGDPDGFLEISSSEVSYFDPFTESRIDGLEALRVLYDGIRGKIKIDRSEIIEPRVQIAGDVAILTFRFESHGSEGSVHWNTTEVYRRTDAGWLIVHTHWAFRQPKLAG